MIIAVIPIIIIIALSFTVICLYDEIVNYPEFNFDDLKQTIIFVFMVILIFMIGIIIVYLLLFIIMKLLD